MLYLPCGCELPHHLCVEAARLFAAEAEAQFQWQQAHANGAEEAERRALYRAYQAARQAYDDHGKATP